MPRYKLTWTNTETFTGEVEAVNRAAVSEAWLWDEMYDTTSTGIEQECISVRLVPGTEDE